MATASLAVTVCGVPAGFAGQEGGAEALEVPRGRSLLTLLLLAGTLAGVSLGPDNAQLSPGWTATNGFDEGIRNALVAKSASGRAAARISSDVLLASLGAGLVGDWIWLDKRGDYGLGRSVTTDSSWVLATLITTESVKSASRRPRPYVSECALDSGYVDACGSPGQFNRSFFSGHTSTSATLAGLICARHLALAKRDRTDWLICGGAASASLATGLLRITADQHYASDVLVGWGVGVAFGYVLPRVFDYRGKNGPFSRIAMVPIAGQRQWGMMIHYAYSL